MKYKIPVEELKSMPKPEHIAIIMDGNGRYAQAKGFPRTYGHLKGVGVVEKMTEFCAEIGIKILTLYSFSTENWKRPETEVSYLMSLFYSYMKKKLSKFMKNNVKFNVIGQIEGLPKNVQEMIAHTKAETASNTGMILNLAVNYSGRTEILDAMKKIMADFSGGKLPFTPSELAKNDESAIKKLNALDGSFFQNYLYAPAFKDPDLLIRTSNEFRVSNFLLWEIAYSEIFITDKFWPEFTQNDLIDAILNYNSRERRFGGLSQNTAAKK
ncbi:MAG: polyprenyl diphosphate synthase [Candidatus Wallbacteria bacterium]|mgnify:CR=1 FL=1